MLPPAGTRREDSAEPQTTTSRDARVDAELAKYLPQDRLRALASGEPLDGRREGAVLFADVSGFTPLAAALAEEHGPQRGAELLVGHLNTVCDRLVYEVDRHRGSVLHFSGDAITAFFEGDVGARAAAVGLAMLRAMAPFRSPGGAGEGARVGAPLALKVGIAAGLVRRFVVGDPAIQRIDMIAGRTVDRAAVAEASAAKNEVVLSAEVAAALGSAAALGRVIHPARAGAALGSVLLGLDPAPEPSPWPAADLGATTAARLTEWVLPSVAERLASGQGDFLAEIRRVAALFLAFEEVDFDGDEAAPARVDAYIRRAQDVIARYGGALLSYTSGDKGNYLYAAFGAPISHEDDDRRAVAAALALRTAPPELGIGAATRIGISAGRMRAGAYGGDARRTYAAMGNHANVAARLMQRAAPGQIVVGDRVAAATTRRFEMRSLGEATLKGLSAPIALFEVVGEQRSGSRPLPPPGADDAAHLSPEAAAPEGAAPDGTRRGAASLFGREHEQQILAAALRDLARGEGPASRVLVLEGDAGIGKSRLLDHAVALARGEIEDPRAADATDRSARPITTLVGLGDSVERATPYLPWRGLLGALVGFAERDAAPLKRDRLLAHIAAASDLEHVARFAPLLDDVFRIDLEENEVTRAIKGEVRARNARELVVALLSSEAKRRPLFLAIEDAHWLDSASWALLVEVAERVEPMVLVLTTRPPTEATLAAYRRLLERPGTTRIALGPLANSALDALLAERIGPLTDSVRAAVLERAQGNPFYCEELAFTAQKAGPAGRANLLGSASGATPTEEAGIPDAVHSAIVTRIDGLRSGAQLTLKVASVLGRTFAREVLDAVFPVATERAHLPAHLDELDRSDMTRRLANVRDDRYIFKHIITQEVAYGLMLSQQRRELHQHVAEWYERAHEGALDAFSPLLAQHWTRAAHHRRALPYLEKAAGQALRSGAYREAIGAFSGALAMARELAEDSEGPIPATRLATWEAGLAEAHHGLSQFVESRAHYERALALLGRPITEVIPGVALLPGPARAPTSAALGWAKKIGGALATQIGHRLRPATVAARRGPATEEEILAAETYRKLSFVAYHQNDTLSTVATTLLGLNLAESAGIGRPAAELYASTAVVCGLLGLHGAGRAYVRRSLEAAGELDDLSTRLWTLLSTSWFYCGLAEWTAARTGIDEAVRLADRLGELRIRDESMLVRAVSRWSAPFPERVHLWRLALDSATERGDTEVQAWARALGASCLSPMGRAEEAVSELTAAAGLLHERSARTGYIKVLGALALAHARLRQLPEALTAADRAADVIAASSPILVSTFDGYAGTAETYLRAWSSGRADLAPRADQSLRELWRLARPFPVARARAHLLDGWALSLRGKTAAAARAFEKSLAAAAELRLPYEAARAHQKLAALTPDSARRASHREQARRTFHELGATADLEET